MTTTRILPQACPACNHLVDAVGYPSNDPDPTPRDGDLTICGNCLAVNRFQGGIVRCLTPQELASLPPDTQDGLAAFRLDIQAVQAASQLRRTP